MIILDIYSGISLPGHFIYTMAATFLPWFTEIVITNPAEGRILDPL